MITQLEQKLDITKLPGEYVSNQNTERLEDNRMPFNEEKPTKSIASIEYTNELDTVNKPIVVKEAKKTKKVKKKKKEKTEKKEKKEKSEKTSERTDKKSEKIADLTKNNDKIVRISKLQSTEEMPANTIDYIWDVNRLNLLLEDATQCLGSIKEELPIR